MWYRVYSAMLINVLFICWFSSVRWRGGALWQHSYGSCRTCLRVCFHCLALYRLSRESTASHDSTEYLRCIYTVYVLTPHHLLGENVHYFSPVGFLQIRKLISHNQPGFFYCLNIEGDILGVALWAAKTYNGRFFERFRIVCIWFVFHCVRVFDWTCALWNACHCACSVLNSSDTQRVPGTS